MALEEPLNITWYGQSMFTLSGGGVTVACDPTPPETGYTYEPVHADIVLISHGHFDHNYTEGVSGNPALVAGAGTTALEGLSITGMECFHDASGGRERGENLIFTWEQAGFRLAHLGDLGHYPEADIIARLHDLDVVMMPVGGVFTINAGQAARLAGEISPCLVIPMHFKTDACTIPLEKLDEFWSAFRGPVSKVTERPLVLTPDILPASTEAWALPYQ